MNIRELLTTLDSIDTKVNTPIVESTTIKTSFIPTKKEFSIAQELTESFGYTYVNEAPIDQANLARMKARARAGSNVVTPVAAMAAAAPTTSVSMAGKVWQGVKKFGGKLALPLAAAAEIWDGYSRIKALPTTMDATQYRSEVTKIVTSLVTHFGLFWVGMVLGAAIAGAFTGPGAIVGAIAGGVAGLATEYMLGDSVDTITDAIVNKLYNTKNISKAKQGAQPSTAQQSTISNNGTAPTQAPATTPADSGGSPLEKYYDQLTKG